MMVFRFFFMTQNVPWIVPVTFPVLWRTQIFVAVGYNSVIHMPSGGVTV